MELVSRCGFTPAAENPCPAQVACKELQLNPTLGFAIVNTTITTVGGAASSNLLQTSIARPCSLTYENNAYQDIALHSTPKEGSSIASNATIKAFESSLITRPS